MKKGNYAKWKNFSGESLGVVKSYKEKIERHGQGPFKIKNTSQINCADGELVHFINQHGQEVKINSQYFEEITRKEALKIISAKSKK